MDRYLVVSSDCHAGLPPERYREYLDPGYREIFDASLPVQLAETRKAAAKFLVADVNAAWRQGRSGRSPAHGTTPSAPGFSKGMASPRR